MFRLDHYDLIVLLVFLNNSFLGWAAGESLLERLGPLWIGARATEFNWDFILLSLGATLSIVRISMKLE